MADSDEGSATGLDKNSAIKLEFYKDRGQWARHYSTVRLTLGTFFVTLSVGILHFRWNTPELKVGIGAFIICALGAFLFSAFSKATFDEMKGQMEIVNFLQPDAGIDLNKYDWKKRFIGLPIAIIFLVLFAIVDGWWVCSTSHKHQQSTVSSCKSDSRTVRAGSNKTTPHNLPKTTPTSDSQAR